MASNIYKKKKLLKDAENEQYDIKILLNKLKNYNPTKPKITKPKEETLSAAKKLLSNGQEVIDAFKTGIFPYMDGFQIKEESEEESEEELEEELEEKKSEEIKDDFKKFIEYIEEKSEGVNYNLFRDYFNFPVPSALAKKIYETKNKNKNNELVEAIKSRWSDLKDKIKKMPGYEKKIEQPDKTLKIVKEVLDFDKKIRKQQGLGLKILTPNQMLSSLPISLAQLKAGNNSEKLKNEIRQILYSLYQSKKLSKNLCKSLVDTI